jgi:hypothetical protein
LQDALRLQLEIRTTLRALLLTRQWPHLDHDVGIEGIHRFTPIGHVNDWLALPLQSLQPAFE